MMVVMEDDFCHFELAKDTNDVLPFKSPVLKLRIQQIHSESTC